MKKIKWPWRLIRKFRWFFRHKILRKPVPQWHEVPYDATNRVGVCVGKIYSGGPWGGGRKTKFDSENFGIVSIKTRKRED